MRYAFLEKLANEGQISVREKNNIYDTCEAVFQKLAMDINPHEAIKLGPYMSNMGLLATTGIAAVLGNRAWNYIKDQANLKSEIEKIKKAKQSVLKSPDLAKYLDKASARYDELMRLSPAVATMPELATKLVQNRLHNGFTDADIHSLAALQAQYEPNKEVPRQIKEHFEKITKISSQDQGNIAATIVKIMAEAGLGETKTAGDWKAVAKNVLSTGAILSGFGLASGIATGAINQLINTVEKKKLEGRLQDSFNEALKRSSPSSELLHANKEKARQAFQTLVHFSPHTAEDPEAARAFMNQVLATDQGVHIGNIKDLSDIEKNLRASRGPVPFLEGFRAGTEATGMSRILGEGLGASPDPRRGLFHIDIKGGTAMADDKGRPLGGKKINIPGL